MEAYHSPSIKPFPMAIESGSPYEARLRNDLTGELTLVLASLPQTQEQKAPRKATHTSTDPSVLSLPGTYEPTPKPQAIP